MFSLPELPYGYAALQPFISERTLKFHHDKHHAAYVKTANALVEQLGLRPDSLEDLVLDAASRGEKKLYNNAAQAWNHGFFWACMAPRPERPEGRLESAIAEGFGDLGALKQKFTGAGVDHFGSGWVWLLAGRDGKLEVRSTHDADDPLVDQRLTPLLVCDLWEHAYYLDYQNDRKGFLDAWFDHLANWSLAAAQLVAATGQGQAWRYPGAEAPRPASARQAAS